MGVISSLTENNKQIAVLNWRIGAPAVSSTPADEEKTSRLITYQAEFFLRKKACEEMAIKMQESAKFIAEINAKASEMDSESLELVECAFRALREVLPHEANRENLSDLEVLKLAMEYIHDLEELLHFESSNNCH